MRLELMPDLQPPAPRTDRDYLLYVHIPFCESLCPFCPLHKIKLDAGKATTYFRALAKELELYRRLGYDFSALYVGGGTPTVMPEQLSETLNLIRSLFSVRQISLETNPNHLREPVLSLLKAAGVNRLSVGVQSFDDRLLKEMHRYASYGSSSEIIERLTHTQDLFDTLNVDMIFNFPHQSVASLQRDVRILSEDIKVDQVSFYPLMAPAETQRAIVQEMGTFTLDREQRFYEAILESMGSDYAPSTVWCFSRGASMIDEYVVDYDEYIGAGSGSFSYLNGVVYSNTFSISHYVSRINEGKTAISARKCLTLYERMQYDFLFQLFACTIDLEVMDTKYGKVFSSALWKEFLLFRLLGAIVKNGSQYRLTRRGMYYWVVMMREFFIGINNFREQMRAGLTAERDMMAAENAMHARDLR
jgi:coproporphyrinogen III oxidase-like Fe-S oxidoreductase